MGGLGESVGGLGESGEVWEWLEHKAVFSFSNERYWTAAQPGWRCQLHLQKSENLEKICSWDAFITESHNDIYDE